MKTSTEWFSRFIIIPQSSTVAEALLQLQEPQNTFAVVGDAEHPQTLVTSEEIARLECEPSLNLAQCLSQLPPALVVPDLDLLKKQDCLQRISSWLDETQAPGVIIYQQNQVKGVVSWEAIAKVLDGDSLTLEDKRTYGDSQVPVKSYICRKCIPPTYVFPRQGDTPTCPKDWLHGSMEEESA
jgi:hypothetical protein